MDCLNSIIGSAVQWAEKKWSWVSMVEGNPVSGIFRDEHDCAKQFRLRSARERERHYL